MKRQIVGGDPEPEVKAPDGESRGRIRGGEADRARIALIEMVFGQAIFAPVASVMAAALLGLALWDGARRERIVFFVAVTAVVAVSRYGVLFFFQRRARELGVGAWERVFVGTQLLSALVWGGGSLYLLIQRSPMHQAVIIAFLIGMTGGTAVIYSGTRLGAILSVWTMLLPATVWCAIQPSGTLRALAAGSVMLLVLTTRGILILGGFLERFFRLTQELESARTRAEVLARTDDLTGLLNRRAFYEQGHYLLDQARRHKRPLAILLLDIDHFKAINDDCGHAAGDSALRAIASTLRRACRRIDIVGRLGGDELAVLLPDTTTQGATMVAERLRRDLAETRLRERGKEILLTCSMGVAGGEPPDTFDELLLRADRAMYQAKGGGRDQVAG
jgi:diguanylate cyclase (GGDEF)-like protein